jgi:hypothetical protein
MVTKICFFNMAKRHNPNQIVRVRIFAIRPIFPTPNLERSVPTCC